MLKLDNFMIHINYSSILSQIFFSYIFVLMDKVNSLKFIKISFIFIDARLFLSNEQKEKFILKLESFMLKDVIDVNFPANKVMLSRMKHF